MSTSGMDIEIEKEAEGSKRMLFAECGIDHRCRCTKALMHRDDLETVIKVETPVEKEDSNLSLDARLRTVYEPLSMAERRLQVMEPIKLFKNKVYRFWHKRYNYVLPTDQQFDLQPYDEIQKRDEEIALEFFYGGSPPFFMLGSDKEAQENRQRMLESYNKQKRKEEEAKTEVAPEVIHTRVESIISVNRTRAQDTTSVFGPSMKEKGITGPVVQFVAKLMRRKAREKERQLRQIPPNSKWHILRQPDTLAWCLRMAERERKHRAYMKFRKTTKVVWAVLRFIRVISSMSRDARVVLTEIKYFQEQQRLLTQNKIDNQKGELVASREVFNPKKYHLSSRFKISNEIRMILTKSWYARTDEEVKKVVDRLQELRCFVEYPVAFQHKLARLAWIIEVNADLAIIREGHIATDFYFMLAGKAKMITLHGSPCLAERGTFHTLRLLKNGDAFGDESMSHPDSERTYSVITTEQCTLLSLSSVDYISMLLNTRMDEVAPEHVIFLSTLSFLSDFPKTKLIEEGDEYIRNYYLRAGSIITSHLSESDYIYVVKYGSCRVLVEIQPHGCEPRTGRRSTEETERDRKRNSVPSSSSISQFDSDVTVQSIRRKSLIAQRHSSVMEFISFHKDDIAKNPAAIDALRSERKNVHLREMQKERVEAEVYQKRSRDLFKSLKNKTIAKSKDALLISASKMHTDIKPRASLDFVTDALSSCTSEGTPAISMSNHSHVSCSSQSIALKGSKSSRTNLEKHLSFDVASVVSKSKSTSGHASRNAVGTNIGIEIDIDLDKTRKPGQRLSRSGSSILTGMEGSRSRLELSAKVRLPSITSATDKTSVHSKNYPYSRWKLLRVLVKGDYIGHEWVNLNRGPFEPPEEEMALVSDGCEVIMMNREFLIKYMRKEM